MLKKADFVHLHTHSDGSINDSIINVHQLIKKVKAMGQAGAAITDHNSLINIPLFINEAEHERIKPIIGDEFYIVPHRKQFFLKNDLKRYHIVVIAKNNEGLKNLIKLNNESWKTNYFKSKSGLNMSVIDIKQLLKYHKGLIVTTACYYGIVPMMLYENKNELTTIYDKIKQTYRDDFYLEIADHGVKLEREVFKKLIKFGMKQNAKFIVTQDAHYLEEKDALPHEILISTRFNYHSKFKYNSNEYYLKSSKKMYDLGFDEKYYKNTKEIMEKVEKYKIKKKNIINKGGKMIINESKINYLDINKIAKKIIMFYEVPKSEWEQFKNEMKKAKKDQTLFKQSRIINELNKKYNLEGIINSLKGIKNNIVVDENKKINIPLEEINFPIMRKGDYFITQWPLF